MRLGPLTAHSSSPHPSLLLPPLRLGLLSLPPAFLALVEGCFGEALEALRAPADPEVPSFSPLLPPVVELPSSPAATVKSALSLDSWYSSWGGDRDVRALIPFPATGL